MKLGSMFRALLAVCALGACDGLVGESGPVAAPAVKVAPLGAAPVASAPVGSGPVGSGPIRPVDEDGNCLTDADCPTDYPHCCQVGGYKACQEEKCDAVTTQTPAR
ncbi:MAG: hypothetical protein U1F43_22680 [Myxococcota bacterium]